MIERPCLDCGEVSEGARCPECAPTPTERRKTTATSRGYDRRWRVLSERARAAQPFCSACGATEQLTADHLPSAWDRRARGLPIRLADVDVLCADCNSDAGSSRPGSARAVAAQTQGEDPSSQGARPPGGVSISDSPRPGTPQEAVGGLMGALLAALPSEEGAPLLGVPWAQEVVS